MTVGYIKLATNAKCIKDYLAEHEEDRLFWSGPSATVEVDNTEGKGKEKVNQEAPKEPQPAVQRKSLRVAQKAKSQVVKT